MAARRTAFTSCCTSAWGKTMVLWHQWYLDDILDRAIDGYCFEVGIQALAQMRQLIAFFPNIRSHQTIDVLHY